MPNGPSAMKTYPPALIQYRRTALEDLADAGVAQVSLLREAEVVYGPMPLSAG